MSEPECPCFSHMQIVILPHQGDSSLSCFTPNRRPCHIATALVQSRLDYANSMLLNTTEHNLRKLQRVQNYLAKSIFTVYPPIPSAEHVHSLHWLPIKDRINFKVAVLVYGLLNSNQPTYLANLLSYRSAARSLRSTDYQLLTQPRCATAFGGHAFSVAAPRIWND